MIFHRVRYLSTGLLLSACILQAQQTEVASPAPQQPQLSPKAAYDDAMRPLDETRHSISNWSAAELSSLTVTLSRARAACQARNPRSFTGPDLIDFARLCALGQEWGTVVLATTLYIDEPAASKPLLADAYAARVDADLHLKSEPDALRDTHAMFTAVPYSSMVAEASSEAIEYMRFSTPDDALSIATEREPLILQRLRESAASAPSPAPGTSVKAGLAEGIAVTGDKQPAIPPAATGERQSLHDLYAQCIALATLLQQANRPEAAQSTMAELEKALPGALPPDESLRIGEERRRYALLGNALPALTLNRSLSMPNIIPAIPAPNTVTVLLLFPDWCTQCITSIAQLPETVSSVEGHSAYYYGLLAETMPEKTPPAGQSGAEILSSFQPGYAAALLAEKPVLTVPPGTAKDFAATDYPFLIVTDVKGVVRVAQSVDADDLNSGGKVDSAVLLISKHWPLPMPQAKPAPSSTIARQDSRSHTMPAK